MRVLEWLRPHRGRVLTGVIVVLCGIIALESVVLYRQRKLEDEVEAQSAKLLQNFLVGDTLRTSQAPGVSIRLQNVHFVWSDKVYIDTGDMAVRALPIQGSVVDFDHINSFVMTLQQSVVRIRPDVLQGMFNESVFNFPESKVRDLKVALGKTKDPHGVQLKGSVNMVTWIAFTMDTHLSIDHATNTLVIDVDKLKVLGFLPATGLLKSGMVHLDKVIALPPNHSLMVVGNRMMVKPFGLFPPPRIDGTMSDVTVDHDMIRLSFSGKPIPAPKSTAKNYVYLAGGTSEFGEFRMLDTDILIVDGDQSDPFAFSLAHYADMVPRSTVTIKDTKSVRVTMPDYP